MFNKKINHQDDDIRDEFMDDHLPKNYGEKKPVAVEKKKRILSDKEIYDNIICMDFFTQEIKEENRKSFLDNNQNQEKNYGSMLSK